ncbi:hypothetical protein F511_22708 [Dorcoceras hygrometricum]|uniref:Uncharacterized protein n=1 Tax=Dorcoceras hygrometricum TaxID=472368 RepID=A0A2Z7BYG5_9LAMI|nr:hypothetical protein F511_22708 [Dorcoceras hygrometricum]
MDPIPSPVVKKMELRFSKKISQPLLACHEIKGEGNTMIEVVLVDSSTQEKIEAGPVAFASVELVVLAKGTDDCTGEGFNERIVTVEGKKLPLLTENLCKLKGGSCVLGGVKFRHHATRVKPTEFRLGARIVGTFDGIIVKEAKTESFAVKCYRNKYYMKKEIPALVDGLWVLKNIQRGGKIVERLQNKEIDTIEKFLIQLLINPQQLKNVDADKLLSSAFKHWGDVMSFDDPDSAQRHLEAVKRSFHQSNSHVPELYSGMSPDTGTAEMVDVSNNVNAPDRVLGHGIPIPDMNPLARCESFGIKDFGLVDGFDIGWDGYVPRLDGTGSVLAESKEVESAVLLMRKDLNRKKITTEANQAGKKQKRC